MDWLLCVRVGFHSWDWCLIWRCWCRFQYINFSHDFFILGEKELVWKWNFKSEELKSLGFKKSPFKAFLVNYYYFHMKYFYYSEYFFFKSLNLIKDLIYFYFLMYPLTTSNLSTCQRIPSSSRTLQLRTRAFWTRPSWTRRESNDGSKWKYINIFLIYRNIIWLQT